jgi:hypothetical protein
MNCDEFERTIIDSSSDHLTEASASDLSPAQAALKHSESCAGCAARLKREERITAGLQALVVEESSLNAPEKVLASLRAAFDEQLGTATAQPVLPRSPQRKWLWGMAAAAMLLVSAITTTLWLRDQRAAVSGTLTTMYDNSSEPQSQMRAAGAQEEQQQFARSSKRAFDDSATIVNDNARMQSRMRAAGTREEQRQSVIHSPDIAKSAGRQIRLRKPSVTDRAAAPGEYFPLTYVAKSEPTEFVQRVRVEISRSTLLSMGVPVNIERGEGLIEAEIIIGEDGVARAVRIIN